MVFCVISRPHKRKKAVTLRTASAILGKIGPSVFYLDVRMVIVVVSISNGGHKDTPSLDRIGKILTTELSRHTSTWNKPRRKS